VPFHKRSYFGYRPVKTRALFEVYLTRSRLRLKPHAFASIALVFFPVIFHY